jgi:tRNA threonylcarbamoyladenosine modification (KEOPS) complex  Pcc1 subunit|tara:strand:+ start:68 stop:352 length:285 start_codon:yes stop_codon:yes gene_type:complete
MSQPKFSKTDKQPFVNTIAEIKFTFDSNIGLALSEALKPEASHGSERFVHTKVEANDKHLTLKLNASDLGDLRAGVNSYFNLVKASYETLSTER